MTDGSRETAGVGPHAGADGSGLPVRRERGLGSSRSVPSNADLASTRGDPRCWGALVALLGACAPVPVVCTTPGTCPEGLECLANRCAPIGGEPVASRGHRLLLRTVELAWVSESADHLGEPPPGVLLGRATSGTSALLLSFASPGARPEDVESAFLLLSGVPGCPPSTPTELSVWRVLGAWPDAGVSWAARPGFSGPWLTFHAQTRPHERVRVDVTELVRRDLGSGSGHIRVAVVAKPRSTHGAVVATGTGPGTPPELEVYLR